jgi:hypothetical protein
MDNNTIATPVEKDEQRTRVIKIAMLCAALAVVCVLFSAAFSWFQPDQLSLSDRYFPTATRTLTPTATFTPTPNLTATQRAFQTTATVLAIQAQATNAASEWSERFSESFDNNDRGWIVDTQEDEYSKITTEIKNGKYRWNALAHQGFIHWVPVEAQSMEDLFLSVEVGLGDYTGSNDSGILFRRDFSGNFYYFGVYSDQRYFLFKYYQREWSELIDRTSTSAIQRGKPNKLTVIAEGDHIMLFINDQFIAEAYDDEIKKGRIALAIEIFEQDQTAIFEFDNIQLRLP